MGSNSRRTHILALGKPFAQDAHASMGGKEKRQLSKAGCKPLFATLRHTLIFVGLVLIAQYCASMLAGDSFAASL